MTNKSTIVRIIKGGAAVGSLVAPGLSARWYERLFLTPLRPARPVRETAWLAEAAREDIDFGDGRTMPVWSVGTGPTVLLVHGWSRRGGQLGAFIAPLRHRGFRVVTYDCLAHGEAGGRDTALPEMARALARVAAHVGPLAGIVAHSVGGAATVIAAGDGLAVARIVLIGAPEQPRSYLFDAARHLGFSRAVAARTMDRVSARYDFAFATVRARTVVRCLNRPALVVHDIHDAEVPFEESEMLASAWPGARLLATSGLGHRRILRDPGVVSAVADFIGAGAKAGRPSVGRPLQWAAPL